MDRAALDAAIAAGLPHGGWCPAGRRAEDGPIPPRYPLRETEAADHETRTRLNVRDSDATLVLARPPLRGGTRLTVEVAEALGRPALVVDPWAEEELGAIPAWLARHGVAVLNVAGPRESEEPGIHAASFAVLLRLCRALSRPAA